MIGKTQPTPPIQNLSPSPSTIGNTRLLRPSEFALIHPWAMSHWHWKQVTFLVSQFLYDDETLHSLPFIRFVPFLRFSEEK